MQEMQEALHAERHNYREGSPHLKHPHLFDKMVARLRGVLRDVGNAGEGPHLLDVGAGEGSFVEPILASGYGVTALEMSRPSVATMRERFGSNPKFVVYFDEDGSLSPLSDQRFDVILYAAVLHHIPDYVQAIDNAITRYLKVEGSLVSFQDPLLYSRLPRSTRHIGRTAYYFWRLGQGNYIQGLQTRLRRLRGVYEETNPADMAEYHVVRNGVDHEAISHALSSRFETVTIEVYWSTQSRFWQRVGEHLRMKNTFAITATGFRG